MPPLPHASTWTADPRSHLHQAVSHGSVKLAEALLADGSIDIDQPDPDGWTPLVIAADRGYSRIVRLLVEKGANASARALDGTTALLLSAQHGHLAIVDTLVRAGAELGATCQGFTALHATAQAGHSKVVELLLRAGAETNNCRPDGVTPLYLASMNGHLDAARELLRAGANPMLARATSSWERGVPLDVAAQNGYPDVVRELIVRSGGVKHCGGASGGVEALRLAARFRQAGIMAMLTEAGVVDSGPALSCAAAYGSEAEMKFLLRQRPPTPAYVNSSDQSGRTPVYCTVSFCSPRSPRVLRMLVDAGADTASAVEVFDETCQMSSHTPLALVLSSLREKKVKEKKATEDQLGMLEAMRRLLLRVDAVHATSWLWPSTAPSLAKLAAETPLGAAKKAPTPLAPMLPILRTRSSRPGLPVAALSR